MERAFGKIERKYMTLEEKHATLEKELEVTKKSRDQKDKHLAVLYKEIEKWRGKAEAKDKENVSDNLQKEEPEKKPVLLEYSVKKDENKAVSKLY